MIRNLKIIGFSEPLKMLFSASMIKMGTVSDVNLLREIVATKIESSPAVHAKSEDGIM